MVCPDANSTVNPMDCIFKSMILDKMKINKKINGMPIKDTTDKKENHFLYELGWDEMA
jgi:hypothetical protein